MLVHSLPTKSRKGLACDTQSGTFATHTGLVHDVTDTDMLSLTFKCLFIYMHTC